MPTQDYECADCGATFSLNVSDEEARGALADHDERCPRCGRRVGSGLVQCTACGAESVVRLPHWHVRCNLAQASCHACGVAIVKPCIC